MRPDQKLQNILTIIGGFLMPLGLTIIAIGWYGAAHTGYVFEQIPYLISGGLLGLGVTITGAITFFTAWLARLIQLQREQTDLARQHLQHLKKQRPSPHPSTTTQQIPTMEKIRTPG